MSELRQRLLEIRSVIARELGHADLPLDASSVPPSFRHLAPFAAQFGIGDDGTRETAVEMMPRELVRGMAQELRDHVDAISDWADEGEFTLEKSAFVALMQAIEYFDYGPAGAVRVEKRKLDELRAELESLSNEP